MTANLRKAAWAAAAAAMLAGCSGDLLPMAKDGTFTGVWDAKPWNGSAYAVLHNDSLTVVAHWKDPQHYYDEYVRAVVPFTGPGTYTLPESGGRLAKIVGGDAGEFPPASGTLVVRAYDASAHTVAGDVTLHAGSVQPAWNASGSFQAPVYSSFSLVTATR